MMGDDGDQLKVELTGGEVALDRAANGMTGTRILQNSTVAGFLNQASR